MEVRGKLHAPDTLPPKRTPFPMEEEAAWVPEAVWTLRKIEKSPDDAMKRKTIPFLCTPQRCQSTKYVIPELENVLLYEYLV